MDEAPATTVAPVVTPAAPAEPLADVPVLTVGGVEVYREGNTLCWLSGMAIDCDGAPDAYCPPGSGLRARDLLANAGRTGRWYGLVTSNGSYDGAPVIQGPLDPCPGYYVSPTALVDHSVHDIANPRRYVDAGRVCYISIPPELLHAGVKLGDVAFVTYRSESCPAIVAEVGPKEKIGEGSCALAIHLGIDPSPIHGGCAHGVTYKIFLGSSQGWPRSSDSITAQVQSLLTK